MGVGGHIVLVWVAGELCAYGGTFGAGSEEKGPERKVCRGVVAWWEVLRIPRRCPLGDVVCGNVGHVSFDLGIPLPLYAHVCGMEGGDA